MENLFTLGACENLGEDISLVPRFTERKRKLCMVPFHNYYIHSYYIHEERRGGEGVV